MIPKKFISPSSQLSYNEEMLSCWTEWCSIFDVTPLMDIALHSHPQCCDLGIQREFQMRMHSQCLTMCHLEQTEPFHLLVCMEQTFEVNTHNPPLKQKEPNPPPAMVENRRKELTSGLGREEAGTKEVGPNFFVLKPWSCLNLILPGMPTNAVQKLHLCLTMKNSLWSRGEALEQHSLSYSYMGLLELCGTPVLHIPLD